jgi:muconolactone delta-isomerase
MTREEMEQFNELAAHVEERKARIDRLRGEICELIRLRGDLDNQEWEARREVEQLVRKMELVAFGAIGVYPSGHHPEARTAVVATDPLPMSKDGLLTVSVRN